MKRVWQEPSSLEQIRQEPTKMKRMWQEPSSLEWNEKGTVQTGFRVELRNQEKSKSKIAQLLGQPAQITFCAAENSLCQEVRSASRPLLRMLLLGK